MAVIGRANVFLTFSSSQITAESILPRGAVRELTTFIAAFSLFWPFIPFLQWGTWLTHEVPISLPSPLVFPGSLIQLRRNTEPPWKCSTVLLIIFCLYSSPGVFSEPVLAAAEHGPAFSCCLSWPLSCLLQARGCDIQVPDREVRKRSVCSACPHSAGSDLGTQITPAACGKGDERFPLLWLKL